MRTEYKASIIVAVIALVGTLGAAIIANWDKWSKDAELSEVPEGMELIPAGEFMMGSNDGEAHEKPVHEVFLDEFYMDKYEVTNAQYKKFMEAKNYPAPRHWEEPERNALNKPVVGVSWHDANAYAEWAGKRLPTEAEWEKAARGRKTSKYPWGDELTYKYADYENDKRESAYPVGSFSANLYLLYDMAGNVWEWCADWYDVNYYGNSPKNNPPGPDSGEYRILRGGSWNATKSSLRVSQRNVEAADLIGYNIGFRCAKDYR